MNFSFLQVWRRFFQSRTGRFLKGAAAVVLLGWLCWRLLGHASAREAWEAVQAEHLHVSWWWLLCCLILMPLNWFLEALKWQNFFHPHERPALPSSLRSIMGGIALSFLTPNRSGEYAARVLVSPSGGRWPAAYAALGSAYCQMAVLLAFGLPAAGLFSAHGGRDISQGYFFTWLAPGVVLVLLLLAAGIYIRKLFEFVVSIGLAKRLGRWWERIEPLSRFSPQQFKRGLGLAAFRYGVYGVQYYAMLRFSGIVLAPEAVYAGVGTIYLIQTGLPLPPALGFLARGEIALLVWQTWGAATLPVLAATYGLFVINLGLPAFTGVILSLFTRKAAP